MMAWWYNYLLASTMCLIINLNSAPFTWFMIPLYNIGSLKLNSMKHVEIFFIFRSTPWTMDAPASTDRSVSRHSPSSRPWLSPACWPGSPLSAVSPPSSGAREETETGERQINFVNCQARVQSPNVVSYQSVKTVGTEIKLYLFPGNHLTPH